MFQLGGHGQDDRAEGVAGGANCIGASEVCSGCRLCQRCRQEGQVPVSMVNCVMIGTMGGKSV
jgi:hypothetical protein